MSSLRMANFNAEATPQKRERKEQRDRLRAIEIERKINGREKS